MPNYFSVGYAAGVDGREVCIQAIERAKASLAPGADEVALALIFSSNEFPLSDLMNGINAGLRDVPVAGYSTSDVLVSEGARTHGVAVALMAGDDLKGAAQWWGGLPPEAGASARKWLASQPVSGGRLHPLFIFAEGLDTLAAPAWLPVGCLTGETGQARGMYQFGGGQGGAGLAAAILTGELGLGVGVDHGWQPVGLHFTISKADGLWVRELDERPATEVYAGIFGQQTRQWLVPPLNEMVRLYPFGMDGGNGTLHVCSPVQVEVDGSFRMSAPVAGGGTGHLMVGSAAACEEAVRRAARQALAGLGAGQKPGLALVFVDVAWKMLAEAQGIRITEVLGEEIGPEVPVAGGYSVGQVWRAAEANDGTAGILSQHIQVILLA